MQERWLVFLGQAVEVEVERIEAGAQVAAVFFIPDEGQTVQRVARQ